MLLCATDAYVGLQVKGLELFSSCLGAQQENSIDLQEPLFGAALQATSNCENASFPPLCCGAVCLATVHQFPSLHALNNAWQPIPLWPTLVMFIGECCPTMPLVSSFYHVTVWSNTVRLTRMAASALVYMSLLLPVYYHS